MLYQMQENDKSRKNISALVFTQENMNSLIENVIDANTKEELLKIKQAFTNYENEFESINDKIYGKDKTDFIDFLIDDIDKHEHIALKLEKLSKNEKEIEKAFDEIYLIQTKQVEYTELFNDLYPKENLARKNIEDEIMERKKIVLLKDFSDVKYYSKEFLFQKRNEEAYIKWVSKIELLKNNYPSKALGEYFEIVKDIGSVVLVNEALMIEEHKIVNNITKVIFSSNQINTKIEMDIENLSQDFKNTVYLLTTVLFLITIFFIIILAYRVNKNVSLSVDEIEQKVHDGLTEINKLNDEIENTQKEVVFTMGAIGESRSKETGNHVKRVAEYSKLLANLYGLEKAEAEMLKQASPMHDIGKVAIPDAILNKPARFTDDERMIMNTHAGLGFEMLKHSNRPLLKAASIIAHEHHEKWDGSGYPRGKSGDDIHIYGRITALADVFDALGSDRCYKKAWDDEKIFALFKEESGKHFDPKLVELFFEHLDEFLKIRDTFKDVE
ncbi:MAG: HD domain-containing protein [Arcobacteraceae bacterium]|nr:HD domain-containing protein [Arcobacteraceae bacterium]